MEGMTIRRALAACGGQLHGAGDPEQTLERVIIDSRAVQPGDLFAALRGEKTDGHRFIDSAFERGAACCLAEYAPEGEERLLILVPDVEKALEQITAAFRADLTIPVIGITGSVGKTSAKEMIAAVLSQRYRVLKTEGNLNNQLGVPMTVSRIRPEHQAAVVEMGISGFGEMSGLARIVRPTMAVFTVIGSAHLEFLHDRDGVLKAKTEMLDFMEPGAPVLMNGDDDKQRGFVCRQKKILFGLSEGCDVRAVDVETLPDGHTSCRILYEGREVSVDIPAFGRHMIYAALEGAAVGFLCGLTDEEIRAGVSAYETVGRRAAVCDTGTVTLIDDCYNANPDSSRCGVDSLLQLPGRHVCVFGDMLELGESGPELHYELGRYAREKGVDLLIACGPLSEETARGAKGIHYVNRQELIRALPELLHPGDAVLVKASRSMHFEEISDALKELKWS